MASFFRFKRADRQPIGPPLAQAAVAAAPVEAPLRNDGVMDLVEEDVRRSQGLVDAAFADVDREIDRGAVLSGQVVAEAGALAAGIARAVADVDGLASNFGDIEEAGRAIGRQIEAATGLAAEARSGARRAGEGVAGLEAAIARIETVVGLIAKVARQTNLLALNATIEAERAGSLGRGFAVVASEVKSLSTETQRATDEISRTIAGLQAAAMRSSTSVEDVVAVIERITPTFAAVAEAVAGQDRMIAEAAERAGHMRNFVDGVSGRAEAMRSNSAQAAEAVEFVRRSAAGLSEINRAGTRRLTTVLRQSPGSDRRRHDRFPATIPAVLTVAGRPIQGRTVDLSLGGALVDAPGCDPAIGSRVEVDLAGLGTGMARIVACSSQGIHLAFETLDRQALVRHVEGLRADYQPLIDRATAAAARISAAFDDALRRRELTDEVLFDTAYVRVPDSDPPQVTTRALEFLERILPPIQEPLLASDSRMVFCAAIDRNGYLPVHNAAFSKPQRRGDPVWNTANSRNRRIFDDRAGLLAARNMRPFIVQAYPRDMGGGVTVLMKEIDAPIAAAGRHWGGFRTAYRI